MQQNTAVEMVIEYESYYMTNKQCKLLDPTPALTYLELCVACPVAQLV